jgi:vacuolar-type H+-ATPase subunit I/STV1
MKIKLTNRDVIGLYNTLDGLNYRGVKFAYTIARNLNSMKPIMNAMDRALKVAPEFTEYDKARVELAKTHADKDAKTGKPVVDGNNFVIKDMEKFEAELKVLQEKYKEVIDARQKQLDDYAVLQDEEVEIEVLSIPQSLLPAEITTKEMAVIFPIVETGDSILSPLSDELSGKKKK